MQITNFTDYSLRTLLYLAAQGDANVKGIADYYGISRNHLVKVVHRLNQLGYVATTRGKGGGISIAPHAREVRLGDLIEQLEPHMNLVECFDPATDGCRVSPRCRVKGILKRASANFLATLNEVTLSDVAIDSRFFDEGR